MGLTRAPATATDLASDKRISFEKSMDRFFSEIEFFGYCKVAELKSIFVRSRLGEWVCIGLVGLFKTDLSQIQPTTIFEIEDVFIEKQAVDIQSLREIINKLIETGFVDTKIGKFPFGCSNASLTNLQFKDRAGYVLYLDEQFNSVALEGYTAREGDLYDLKTIDLKLQSQSEPYDGLWDLTLEKIGKGLDPSHSPSITIIAPRYMKTEAIFEEDKLKVILTVHREMNLSNFKMTSIVRGENKYPAISRTEIPLIKSELHKGDLVRIVSKLDLKDPKSAQIFLFHRTDEGFTMLVRENLYATVTRRPRQLIHQYIDPDFITLETWVRGIGNKSIDFEWALSLLLTILGFSAEWTGHAFEGACQEILKRSLGVDLVAFNPDDSIVIIGQCTTKKLPSEKVAELKITCNELKEKLKDTQTKIIPTLFTLHDEDIIKDEIENVRKEGIVVVGIQGIEELLTHMRVGTNLESVISSVFEKPRIINI